MIPGAIAQYSQGETAMKKQLFTFVSALCIATLASATTYMGPTDLSKQNLDDVVIHGPADLQQVKAKSLSVMGPLHFKDLQVEQNAEIIGPVNNSETGKFNQIKVTGPLQVKQVTANSLQVIGPVQADNLAVSGDTVLLGPLTAQRSKFQNITVTAEKVNLTDVVANNIFIKKVDGKQPTLTLAGNTVINGSIQFESKDGIVVKGSKVEIKGQIIGGELKK